MAGRTLCNAVDFSHTEHLRRFAHFGSWVVHPPTSQAQQRVKLRRAVQRTYKAGQQCKEGLNWTEYKDEPFHLSFFMEYVAKPPAMQSAASAQPDARVQQHDSAAKPLQPIPSNGGSAQPRCACFSSQEHSVCQQAENVLPNGQHAGRLSAGMQSGVPRQLLQQVQHIEQTARCAALAASTGGALSKSQLTHALPQRVSSLAAIVRCRAHCMLPVRCLVTPVAKAPQRKAST